MKTKLLLFTTMLAFLAFGLFSDNEIINYGRNLIITGFLGGANKGDITLTVNKTEYLVDSTIVTFSDTDVQLLKGKFVLDEGTYGGPYLNLTILPQFTIKTVSPKLTKGIEIHYGISSTNWWYRNRIDLSINLQTISEDSLRITLIQEITGDQKPEPKKIDTVICLSTDSLQPDFWLTVGP